MSIPDFMEEITLPEQYTVRPATMDDAGAVCALINEVNIIKGYPSKGGVDELRADWQEPGFTLEDSSLIIEDEDGKILAYASIWDVAATPVRPWCPWTLHDDYYGTELQDYVLNWLEQKAHRVIEKCPPDAKIVMQTNALKGYDKRVAALEDTGFSHKRNFYRMLIEMDEAPPQAKLPDNIEIRGMRFPDEIEAMAAAIEVGFKDHWGFVEEPLEEAIKFWTHYTETDKLFDPAIYFLAIDTKNGDIAGLALCRIEQVGKPDTAYVEELAVLPDYRRQGLALAMLHHAFGEFYKRGRKKVALHVDASSLTGATRLYGKAGMKPVETWMNFQKLIRDGIELSTTSLE